MEALGQGIRREHEEVIFYIPRLIFTMYCWFCYRAFGLPLL